jgi:hypothetical protein
MSSISIRATGIFLTSEGREYGIRGSQWYDGDAYTIAQACTRITLHTFGDITKLLHT